MEKYKMEVKFMCDYCDNGDYIPLFNSICRIKLYIVVPTVTAVTNNRITC